MNKEVEGIWKYLHHLLSGALLFIEGVILLFFNKSWLAVLIFMGIGAFLFIDDLFAETIDKSVFNHLNSDPIRLKIAGILFFTFMQIIFFFILLIY